jgi:hypothetical protein
MRVRRGDSREGEEDGLEGDDVSTYMHREGKGSKKRVAMSSLGRGEVRQQGEYVEERIGGGSSDAMISVRIVLMCIL